MGFRFRRAINLGGLARLNLAKSGPSVSVGGHGLRAGVGRRGLRLTAGIPGTGVYYTTTHRPHGAHRTANPRVVRCYYAHRPDMRHLATVLAGTGWHVARVYQQPIPRGWLARLFLPTRLRWVVEFRR